jgi:hypothetical protein
VKLGRRRALYGSLPRDAGWGHGFGRRRYQLVLRSCIVLVLYLFLSLPVYSVNTVEDGNIPRDELLDGWLPVQRLVDRILGLLLRRSS